MDRVAIYLHATDVVRNGQRLGSLEEFCSPEQKEQIRKLMEKKMPFGQFYDQVVELLGGEGISLN